MGDDKKKGKTFVSNFLLEDIVEEILIRTPAEKLIELKVVCKSWYCLISDHKFVEAHLRYWKSRTAGLICNMMMPDQKQRHCFLSFDLKYKDMIEANTFNLNIEDCMPARATSHKFRVLSSCDGLLLVYCSEKIFSQLFVCNPVTKLRTRLRPDWIRDFTDFTSHSWTLAYDSSIQKYQVFGLFLHACRDQCYTLTLDCSTCDNWRKIPTYHSHDWISPACVSANGKLHWMASHHDNSTCLLSMDIVTEEFKETSCPLHQCTSWDIFLEMNGCLYIIGNKYFGPLIDIWVLKDWDTMVWSKDHAINLVESTLFLYRPYYYGRQTWPITMVDPLDSKFIFQYKDKLISHGLQCKEWREITIHGQGTIPLFNYLRSFDNKHLSQAHVNSLVSWH